MQGFDGETKGGKGMKKLMQLAAVSILLGQAIGTSGLTVYASETANTEAKTEETADTSSETIESTTATEAATDTTSTSETEVVAENVQQLIAQIEAFSEGTLELAHQDELNQLIETYNALSGEEKAQVTNAAKLEKMAAAMEKLVKNSQATQPKKATKVDKTITVAVERFVIGQGYIMEPQLVHVTQDVNYAVILDELFKQQGLQYTNTGSPESGFYLSGVTNADNGKTEIPKELVQFGQEQYGIDLANPVNGEAPNLKEFSYSGMAGWMYSVNNEFPGVGMSDKTPEDGDVFRVQFTLVGYGADLGSSFGGNDALPVANKTALTQKIAEINQDAAGWQNQGAAYQKAYENAQKVLVKLLATQAEVDEALTLLEQPAEPQPDPVADVIASIEALGDITSLDQEAQVTAARKAYDALTKEQQVAVGEKKLAQLVKAEEKIQDLKNEQAADEVINMIAALPTVDEVALSDQKAVESAEAAYKKLTEAQQKLVTNHEKLVNLLERLTELANEAGFDLQKSLETASNNIINDGDLGDWGSLAVARSGYPASEELRLSSYKKLAGKVLEYNGNYGSSNGQRPWTDAERQTIGIISLGGNPRNVGGIDLIQLMVDHDLTGTINNQIYGLIALSLKDYGIKGQEEQIQKLLAALVKAQLADGGWALFGKAGDIDITGMTLTALAPYKGQPEVAAAIEKGVSFFKKTMTADADFFIPSWFAKEPNSNSQAQAIIGLSAVGEDLTSATYTTDNGKNPVKRLAEFQLETGGFKWLLNDQNENGMATEQAVHALSQYAFSIQGKGSIYDFDKNPVPSLPDETAQTAANRVTALIQALPAAEKLTLDNEDAVKSADLEYRLLPKETQALLTSDVVAKLSAAVARIKQLNDDVDIAYNVELQIGWLPKLDKLVLADEAKVVEVRGLYDALTKEQQKLIPQGHLEKLISLETKLVDLKKADQVIKEIDKLPELESLSLADKEAVWKVKEAFDYLTSVQKEYVTNKETLNLAINKINTLSGLQDVEGALKSAAGRIKEKQSILAEWNALALARSGYPADEAFRLASYQVLAKAIEAQDGQYGSGSGKRPWTDAERQAIGVLALGGNPRDVAGIDLIKLLATNELTGTINNQIFGLIVLGSNDYGLQEQKDQIDTLITALLSKQFADGGWALFGKTGDIDITGMTLTALAPYKDRPEVQTAINKAVAFFKNNLTAEGDFFIKSAFATEANANSQAQAILGLSAVGEDLTAAVYTNEAGINPVNRLIQFQLTNGGFKWLVSDTKENDMATEQAVHALAQFTFQQKNKGTIYDFAKNPVPQLAIESTTQQAERVAKLIEGLPVAEALTLADKEQVAQVQQAFETITLAAQKLISADLKQKLQDCLAKIAELEEDWSIAEKVVAELEKIGNKTDWSLKDKEWIQTTRAAYEDLTVSQQKMITKEQYGYLVKAEEILADLEATAALIQKVSKQIQELPTANQLKITDREKVEAANQAFNQLSANQKEQVQQELIEKLQACVKQMATMVADQEKAQQVEQAIEKLPTVNELTGKDEAAVQAVRKQYDDLTKGQQAYVTKDAVAKLTSLEKQLVILKDQAAAKAVSDLIKKLPMLDKLSLADRVKVESARQHYDALNKTQQQYVTNIETLNKAEKRLAELMSQQDAYEKVLNETQGYVLGLFQDYQPTFTNEWMIMDLARNGQKLDQPLFQEYYQNVVTHIQKVNGQLHTAKYTEFSRLALAVTAIGKDARDVGGYNLFDYLSDFNKVTYQGINGAIFALIAVDTRADYRFTKPMGVKEYTTREKLIQHILDKELAAGGWNLFGAKPNIDITAMALQALAPYKDDAKVGQAIERALATLSKLQNETGTFGTVDTQNSEEIAQVITALTALGINPAEDKRFVKKNNLIQALNSFHIKGSGFVHVLPGGNSNGGGAPGEVNGMASEQAFYALVAYDRFLKNETRLYDMNDVPTESDKEAAKRVTKRIEALGKITSLDQKDAVLMARAAYEGLTKKQKALVSKATYSILAKAEALIQELEASASEAELQAEAEKVSVEIDLLPTPNQVTLKDEARILLVRNHYNELPKAAKQLVKNVKKLELAEAQLEALKNTAIKPVAPNKPAGGNNSNNGGTININTGTATGNGGATIITSTSPQGNGVNGLAIRPTNAPNTTKTNDATKKAAAKQADKQSKGWQFAGDDYLPETAAPASEPVEKETTSSNKVIFVLEIAVAVAAGAAATAGGFWFFKRRG